ncbi:sulfur carrier protein [Lysobacter enzymogenes]
MPSRASRPRLAALRGSGDNAGMNILLNGEARALTAPVTVDQLLAAEGLGERRVAVEINGEIVPRGRHALTALTEGDKVEIVHALGGG